MLSAGLAKALMSGPSWDPEQIIPKYAKWCIDYFELKLLKLQLMQEPRSDTPLCFPENRK